ncbi:PEP-CTERM sorting domain-containing protein [Paludisphaera rhizosphaerae]|uniref:PEP-CTERM sorting domain-containing protein n=1 Tax=Paludisphaera rhizosphaerae TaxID=2711216 RepID=UPI0013EAC76C|nr:PEP-CTERM sorting domain-containing protein [Paludisphaera rhizosphaerae]
MTIRLGSFRFAGLFALILAIPGFASADVIVNINSSYYGYAESGLAPTVGQVVTPISEAPGGGLNQLILTAGTYMVTNAYGEVGALYNAFRFNESSSGQNWAWSFLISNESDANKTVLFGMGSALGSSAAEVASQAAVQNFTAYFTLSTNAVLNFMVRDNAVGDNTGGVSLRITQVSGTGIQAVPEPAGLVLLGIGALASIGLAARRRSA